MYKNKAKWAPPRAARAFGLYTPVISTCRSDWFAHTISNVLQPSEPRHKQAHFALYPNACLSAELSFPTSHRKRVKRGITLLPPQRVRALPNCSAHKGREGEGTKTGGFFYCTIIHTEAVRLLAFISTLLETPRFCVQRLG